MLQEYNDLRKSFEKRVHNALATIFNWSITPLLLEKPSGFTLLSARIANTEEQFTNPGQSKYKD